jgi:hypothetical protein
MNIHASTGRRCCPVVELRQYTLKPGQRDILIDLFDRHFVESQEAVGMTVIGQFRDQQRPDRFVWMRGFPDMASRHRSLEQFYNGPVWAAHGTAANDTMLDSDDVLLLRPARSDSAFLIEGDQATAAREPCGPTTVVAGIYALVQPPDESLVSLFERQVAPQLHTHSVELKGVFVTKTAANTFTRLPVREGEHVLVWVGTVAREDLSRERLKDLAAATALNNQVPTILDLEPTSRSRLGGGIHAERATKHDR